MPTSNNKEKPEFFRLLPSEIVIDILSRLPIRTIVICKCVCRSWRDLIPTREFAHLHLSKSVPGLVIGTGAFHTGPKQLKVFEFDDELGLQHHDLHYKQLTKIDSDFIRCSVMKGSANGLLLLCSRQSLNHHILCICNPITREYIDLPYDMLVYSSCTIFAFGVGVSRMTRQHKVVKLVNECKSCDHDAHALLNVTVSICLVYTLGTGMWRSITPPPAPFLFNDDLSTGVYMNGNLHWLVQTSDGSHCICCFDLEAETFSTFSLPSALSGMPVVGGLVVLGDCLCASNTTEDDVVIWVNKKYGDEKSWTKEFVMRKDPYFLYDDFAECDRVVHLIKVFKDGDILMALQDVCMIYYSSKTKTTEQVEVFSKDMSSICVVLHTSSFLSLRSFVNETVSRF